MLAMRFTAPETPVLSRVLLPRGSGQTRRPYLL